MMSALDQIVARKQALIAKSDDKRNDIARIYYEYQARTVLTRQITKLLRNPLVLAGIGLVALKMPWSRVYRLGGWAWRGWRLLRFVRRFAF